MSSSASILGSSASVESGGAEARISSSSTEEEREARDSVCSRRSRRRERGRVFGVSGFTDVEEVD